MQSHPLCKMHFDQYQASSAARGGRYQKEMIRYDTEPAWYIDKIRYPTILALPFPFPRKIEISA